MNVHKVNPYTRPAKGTATERVWQIADDLTDKLGHRAGRKEVMAEYIKEGGNRNTASTQYYYWSQQFVHNEPDARPKSASAGTFSLKLDANGRLHIPSDVRDAMNIGADGKLSAQLVDGELRLISPMMAIHQFQKLARSLVGDDVSVVDEFIAEKREEAARE